MNLINRFIHYYKPYRKIFFLDMFCILLASFIDLAFPQLLKILTDTIFRKPDSEIMRVLPWIASGLAVMYLVRYICMYIVGAWGHIMGARMESDMRQALFQQYQKLSFSYYDRNNTGEMISKLINDLFDITEVAHHGPETLLLSTIKITGAFILLLLIDIRMTMLLLAVTLIMAVFTFFQNRRIRKIFTENRHKIAAVNAGVMDSLSGIRVVKSFGNEKLENEKFDKGNQAFLDSKMDSYRALGKLHAGNSFFEGLLYIVILAGGGWFIAQGGLAPDELAIYALYVAIYMQPLNMLLHFTEQFQRGYTGFKRFDDIMRLTPEIIDDRNAKVLETIHGDVRYSNVSFSYEADREVLHKIDLHLEPGKSVALVGASGGGKSTICALLPRFYDTQSGTITIDGIDVRQIKLNSLRSHIGIVQQDLYMFNGTIRDNIAYGRPDASDSEIIEAAKKANIHDFITSLKDGYDSQVGERGVRLSGGQKQRISIARVFLKNPEILILDEATSALDNESERKIQAALAELSRGRTTLMIAHRLSTVRNADEIAVVENGRIIERGTHTELSAAGGTYARLCRI